jgi:hypothetical protein
MTTRLSRVCQFMGPAGKTLPITLVVLLALTTVATTLALKRARIIAGPSEGPQANLAKTLAVSLGSAGLYGSIVGRVRDAQGALVPGATVSIVNKETNLTRDTVTDEEGTYSRNNVLPGSYDLKVSLTGFREAVRTSVPVSIGQISRVDMALQVGTLNETVTVASAAQLLQTDTADVSTELKSAEITDLPLNRFRNYQALINLVPGSTPAAFENAETDTTLRDARRTLLPGVTIELTSEGILKNAVKTSEGRVITRQSVSNTSVERGGALHINWEVSALPAEFNRQHTTTLLRKEAGLTLSVAPVFRYARAQYAILPTVPRLRRPAACDKSRA